MYVVLSYVCSVKLCSVKHPYRDTGFMQGLQFTCFSKGRSSGAMVLGKLLVAGRPANLDNSRARAYCACSNCGRVCLDILFLICHFCLLSLSLSLGDDPI